MVARVVAQPTGVIMTTAEDERREAAALKSLFLDALERPPDERSAHLLEHCENDGLRALAEGLLTAHASADHALASLAGPGADPAPATGRSIGPYRLFERLGEGRTGVVYRARHEQGGHEVALKVLRSHCHALDELRFEREWHILGQLAHPGIARLFDAGAVQSATDRHLYLAMELVDGPNVCAHARTADLALEGRIELLAQVADALQSAHLHGVIHRDLKPANILVNADGEPKIVDFGVARMVDGERGRDATFTADGDLLGTLDFMSPEQRAGNGSTADQRADVYSLGVVGFELITGQRPYDVGDRSLIESLRFMRETEPRSVRDILPSTPRDLDIVLATATHRAPARRYQSAELFAADLRRVLSDEPIAARAPSTIYRTLKFMRRHRGALAVTCGILIALVGLTKLGLDFTRERNAALASQMEASQRLKFSEYRLDRHVADSSIPPAAFLADLEGWMTRWSSDHRRPAPPTDTATFRKNALEREGWILTMNGNALGPDYLRAAYDIVIASEGEWDQHTFDAQAVRTANLYGDALCAVGDGRQDGADFARANLARCATLEDRLRLEMNIAESLAAAGDLEVAAVSFASIEQQLATLPNGHDHPDRGEALTNRARTLLRLGWELEAREVARSAVDFQTRAQGERNPATLRARMVLAWAALENGEAERAADDLATSLALFEGDSASYFADILDARFLLGRAHRALGHDTLADTLLEQVELAVTTSLPPGNWRREMILAAGR